ncbi:MAG: type II secretion system protein [Planctomycetota bacterium]
MKSEKGKLNKFAGFTIVELLTVMGIIAILMGLLVPALNLVKDYTKELEQKAQFHSIEAALGLFSAEDRYGRYPESDDNSDPYTLDGSNPHDWDPTPYCGANKLAEAVVGWDLLGYHQNSDFRSDGRFRHLNGSGEMVDVLAYHPDPTVAEGDYDGSGNPLYAETAEENVRARWGPFVELENANAFRMGDVYDPCDPSVDGPGFGGATGFNPGNFVLCDVFAKSRRGGKKAGMPVLYYKARTNFTQQDAETDTTADIDDDIYFYPDNYNLLALGAAEDPLYRHPLANGLIGDGGGITLGTPDVTDEDDWQDFENMILNPQVTTIKRPFKAGSYILISAGKDGLYGTPDDIFNFDKE